MWTLLLPIILEFAREVARRIFTTNIVAGVFLGMALLLWLQKEGLIGNPAVADLRVEVALLQKKVDELEATCAPLILERQ